MAAGTRAACVKAFAKLNLCLEVLGRRADGYHDLRTVFQTISLADTIEVAFTPGRKTDAILDADVDIPDNLILRAARAVLESTNAKGIARFRLSKKIPMGAGLGGGSTDAAAVLLALPVLTGRPIAWEPSIELASGLGSDVPFFLMAGSAIGLGRGTELYPMVSAKAPHVLLVSTGVHVSTPDAYRALERPQMQEWVETARNAVQRMAIDVSEGSDWAKAATNDFEVVVFRQHPELRAIKRKLIRNGARLAMMTGSGSAVFGIFASDEDLRYAAAGLTRETVHRTSFVSRAGYRTEWTRQLKEHLSGSGWPLQSRYFKA